MSAAMSSKEDGILVWEGGKTWHVIPLHNNVAIYIENKVVGRPIGRINGGQTLRAVAISGGWLRLERAFCLEKTGGAHECGWIAMRYAKY
jgi:hypothetical protein